MDHGAGLSPSRRLIGDFGVGSASREALTYSAKVESSRS